MRPLLLILAYALGLFAVYYFVVFLPGKKKNQQTRAMHDSIKAGDTVHTIGGLIGTVTERDGDTVTLLIDEKTGASATFVIYAIQKISEKGGE